MEKQHLINIRPNRIASKVLIFVLTVALVITMIPLTGNGDNVDAAISSFNESTGNFSVAASGETSKTINVPMSGLIQPFSFGHSTSGNDNRYLSGYVTITDNTGKPIMKSKLVFFNGSGSISATDMPQNLFLKYDTYKITYALSNSSTGSISTNIEFNWTQTGEKFSYSNGTFRGDYGEREYNGDKNSAVLINNFFEGNNYVGNFYSSGSAVTGDDDFFKIDLKYNAPLYINIASQYTSGSGVTSNLYYNAELIKPDGTAISLTSGNHPAAKALKTGLLDAGTYYLKISCKPSNTASWGHTYRVFVENKEDINKNTWLSRKSLMYYTGNPINFVTSMGYGNFVANGGTPLVENRDYKVTYSNGNTEVGKGTMTVTGINGFSGTKIVTDYTIAPNKASVAKKKTTISSKPAKRKLTVKWKKIKGATHYQIKYRVKGTKKWKSKTVSASETSYTLTKLKKGKKYQYRVRGIQKLKGYSTYYSKYSKTKTSKKIK